MTVSVADREAVGQRAVNRCEYCGLPEGMSKFAHHVDHIIAIKHRGTDEIDNLAWACFRCNVSKGTDIASYDPSTSELTPLYNPRSQKWDDHFTLNGAYIVGKTAIGRVTVMILDMNDPKRLRVRRSLINTGQW
ncbi:MAG: HNH endonuclease [Anaerolineaceae bacterium]|nr:HNH endonuclease [Anaerolineaceae bacterium]